MTTHDIAVFHGAALEKGGGVQVAESLARTFDAPLYFGFCTDDVLERVADDVHAERLCDGRVANWARSRGMARNLYAMSNFQSIPALLEYDVLVQSGDETLWYVPPEDQTVIRYAHSPPGPVYHRFHDGAESASWKWSAFASRILRTPYMSFPTAFVANSETSKRRLRKYFDVDASIAYPPVETDAFESSPTEDYYFSLSRLTEAKGVRELVETFTEQRPDDRLVVGGTGPLEDELRELAGANVEIAGWLSEAEKRTHLGASKAVLLNSGNESFGIVPIEAFASGTPVVSVERGHTVHQVKDGWNGLLYEPGAVDAAVERFERDGVAATTSELQSFAERFSEAAFQERLRDVLDDALAADHVTPPWKD